MPRIFYKHKLILDEQMPHRDRFPQLNALFDVKHVADNLNQSGISDMMVHRLAVKQGRIIVTRNIKHFKPLAGKLKDAGIIGVTGLSWVKIDKQLTALLKSSSPKVWQENTPRWEVNQSTQSTPSPTSSDHILVCGRNR